jgi:hypothetical protein
MADPHFPWDELIELITHDQRVVPILGPELCTLPAEGGATFDETAARRLAQRCGIQLEGPASLARLAQELINQGRPRVQVCRELLAIQSELLAAAETGGLPEPLRHLADIRDFPLILTTCIDGFIAAAIRHSRERDAGLISSALGASADLPRNWAQGPKPLIFHLLGRLAAVPGFALTDEDVLEFMHRMQSEAYRPEQLFDEVRSRHLLIVGVPFTNWLMRFFLRAMHGSRISEDTGQVIILVGDAARRDAKLAGFLREVSRRVWVFEDGGAAEFASELRQRWSGAFDEPWGTRAMEENMPPAEPEPMRPGAVYLSCARGDIPAAERMAAVLDESGLDVWFDRNERQEGARYESRIRQFISQCDLFVPILSRESDMHPEGFFRKEWTWALERDESLEATGSHIVLPVSIDDRNSPSNIPATMRRLAIRTAPDGQPSTELLGECIAAVRTTRSRRAT